MTATSTVHTHGTNGGYSRGCRCVPCTDAMTAYRANKGECAVESRLIIDKGRVVGFQGLGALQRSLDLGPDFLPDNWPSDVCRDAYCGRWERNGGYLWHTEADHA